VVTAFSEARSCGLFLFPLSSCNLATSHNSLGNKLTHFQNTVILSPKKYIHSIALPLPCGAALPLQTGEVFS
jgi:hypothetical protein